MKSIAIAAITGLALTGSAAATVIDTYPDWDGNVTNGWFAIAQSFTAPSDNVLTSWTFAVDAGGTGVDVSVYAWSDASGPVGAALYSNSLPWPAGGGNVTVSGINLGLTTGNLYAFIVDLQGYSGQSVHWQTNQTSYSAGDASWFDGSGWQYLNSGWNTKFRAEFVPAPGALALLGIGGLAATRRRR